MNFSISISQKYDKNKTDFIFCFVDFSIPTENGAYNGLIPETQLDEMKERLSDSKANRHSNLDIHSEHSNQDIDPNGIEVNNNNNNDDEKQQCSKSSVFYSTDLRGGRNSGLFTRIGRVQDIKECAQHCCATERCDLAYMDKSVCFVVICHFPSLCQPVRSVKTHTTLGFVSRNGQTVYDPGEFRLSFTHVWKISVFSYLSI